jgi:hypothetical protein
MHAITVQVPTVLFQSVTSAGGALLSEILVTFANGAALSFLPPADRADLLSQQTHVEIPLVDYILSRASFGEYHYRVQWLFKDAKCVTDTADRVAKGEILIIVPP